MHQPYYRAARGGAFELPWARLHAIKDYADMVEMLAGYPSLHQTFNLVPSLVEQLEDYAAGDFVDVYWEHTLKPAAELQPDERAFLVERMCERPDHPRTRAHPRYLELAQKREACAAGGWDACASSFSDAELRDLQVWFNLAWFDPEALAAGPLRELVAKGRGFREEDKRAIASVQAEMLSRTIPAYREASARGQVELSTSPYYHPILPLLCDSDRARIASSETVLPSRRFAHPEDAREQIENGIAKHEAVFGERPQGMWCSEQAVGEEVVELLIQAGMAWTISDETVLARSLSGSAGRDGLRRAADGSDNGSPESTGSPHNAYLLEREAGQMAIVFRDHTLSDLVGFAYRSWDSRDAAADLLRRLRELRASLMASALRPAGRTSVPLVTIALDGENAWEYYPRDGRDFLRYLYEGMAGDSSLRCVTLSEHLAESPAVRPLEWLHTGSWIFGDLRTWSGDPAHNVAWDLLHNARDLAARRRSSRAAGSEYGDRCATQETTGQATTEQQAGEAWRNVLVAEGSDWFWWFGEHHRTELDHVWDLAFRRRLQEVYRLLGERVPVELFLPILQVTGPRLSLPQSQLAPVIDGLIDDASEWQAAGFLAAEAASTMQRSQATDIREIRFGWHEDHLCLLVIPGAPSDLAGLDIDVHLAKAGQATPPAFRLHLEEAGKVEVSCPEGGCASGETRAIWKDVLEASLPLPRPAEADEDNRVLVVQVAREGLTEHVFHSAPLVPPAPGGR